MGWKRNVELSLMIMITVAAIVLTVKAIVGEPAPKKPVIVGVESCLEES